MNKVYDNGYYLLGMVKNIIELTEKNLSKGVIDKDFMEDLVSELKQYNETDIVSIYYDNPMGYSIEYWTESDVIGGNK